MLAAIRDAPACGPRPDLTCASIRSSALVSLTAVVICGKAAHETVKVLLLYRTECRRPLDGVDEDAHSQSSARDTFRGEDDPPLPATGLFYWRPPLAPIVQRRGLLAAQAQTHQRRAQPGQRSAAALALPPHSCTSTPASAQ
jgi:hypothetical protein